MKIKSALIQMSCGDNVEQNIIKTIKMIEIAANKGAKIVCLQELFNSIYFPQYTDPKYFKYAEKIDGPMISKMIEISKRTKIVLIVPFFEEDRIGVYYNTAAVIDSGKMLGFYRKIHIPEEFMYYEKFYFTPGNAEFPIFNTSVGCIGIGICWDQYFPEVARILALKGAEIIYYPSAVGIRQGTKDFCADAQDYWIMANKAQGQLNSVFIGAINRCGLEGNLQFWGGSFFFNPDGNIISVAGSNDEVLVGELDFDKLKNIRQGFHFFRDRRPSMYKKITDNNNI